ncbi:Uncharacterised protein [Vibrio cholerae]|nr:Uncharacterised protein [Vibrio cholerae]
MSTKSGQMSCGSVASVVVPSTINSTRSAWRISSHARSIPIFSTASEASRSPAVSMMCSGIPSIWICSRRTSRVVPAMSVTMADSLPESALSRLDLPALGRPAITTFIPSRIMAPWLASRRTAARLSMMVCRSAETLPSARKSISSSGKSIAAST